MHAADPVRQIVILRRRDRRRQMRQSELCETREKPLLLLPSEHAEDELGGVRRAAPRHDGQDQAREECMVEVGDRTPAPPQRLVCDGALGNEHGEVPWVRMLQEFLARIHAK
jgi:hypothetical protein